MTKEKVPAGVEIPENAYGFVYSDQVEITFEKPIYVESFFIRINGFAGEKMV
jgi:hypothetical protein